MNIRTLSEVNCEFISEMREGGAMRLSKKAPVTVTDTLFYLTLLLIIIAVIASGIEDARPKPFFGYTFFITATGSMADEIPKGSLIMVKTADTQDLKTGDNITFMRDDYAKMTHKIIDIRHNYDNSGRTGFQTQGVNNMFPDINIVNEEDVIGKVKYVIPKAGAFASFVAKNIYIVFLVFLVWVIICLRRRFKLSRAGFNSVSEQTLKNLNNIKSVRPDLHPAAG